MLTTLTMCFGSKLGFIGITWKFTLIGALKIGLPNRGFSLKDIFNAEYLRTVLILCLRRSAKRT